MSSGYEELWTTLSTKALHPVRVPVLEALWRIGVPLSAIELVDVLDGFVNAWGAAYHLRVLERLDVVEPVPTEADREISRRDLLDMPYRLRDKSDRAN